MAAVESIVVVGATRTAIGRFGGGFKDVPAADLAAHTVKAALERAGVEPGAVDEVVLGCIGQVAEDAFIARVAGIKAGLDKASTAMTVNRLCGSGLQAIVTASQQLALGEHEVVVAGGVESMSRLPYYVRNGRWGMRLGHQELEDGVVTALSDPFQRYHMGVTAENVAERFDISREDQDRFALESQRRAVAAIDNGTFAEEIAPYPVPQRKGDPIVVDTDEHPRRDATFERLQALKPVFKEGGTVTAGNASGINDGAATVVLMRASKAEQLGLRPMARLVAHAVAGVEPEIMGIGPVPAVRKVLEKAGLQLDDIDLIELNEAFAAQSLAVIRQLGLDQQKVNVNGGAIALGHPVGASGAIITVKLLYEMKRRGARYGMSTLCIGGGQGIAAIFERI